MTIVSVAICHVLQSRIKDNALVYHIQFLATVEECRKKGHAEVILNQTYKICGNKDYYAVTADIAHDAMEYYVNRKFNRVLFIGAEEIDST